MTIFSDNLIYDFVGLVVATLVVFITYFKWKFSYWGKVGMPTLNPQMPFGDAKGVLTGKLSIGEQFRDIYEELKSKGVRHGGVYFTFKPFYVPVDPEIIKSMMLKDFQHFVNHGSYFHEEDPLSLHLFNLEDTEWRNMRVKLTPTFTSGKMKMMFQTLADCTVGLKTIMDESATDHRPVDIKEILGRFTTDIIGSCAFGLECNSLKDPDAEFRKYGRRVFDSTGWQGIKNLLILSLPHNLLRKLNVKETKSDVEKFFMNVVKETVNYREKNHIYRKDFMHLLLQLKNRGSVNDDEKIVDESGTIQEKALTMNEVAAQAFLFFAAGYETSSTTMTWALYELALNPNLQEKLREDIDKVMEKHNGKVTYDSIMDMTYLEKVINETLRKHPPVPALPRKCNKDYIVPNTNICIKAGCDAAIPVLGLHMDPEYYPNPTVFDPERFSEENKNSRPSFTWLPFGEGPRLCIGLRFGMLQTKVGLVTLLKNYKITLSKKTKLPVQLAKQAFITSPKDPIWIDVEKLH